MLRMLRVTMTLCLDDSARRGPSPTLYSLAGDRVTKLLSESNKESDPLSNPTKLFSFLPQLRPESFGPKLWVGPNNSPCYIL